ncbi:unnamed protein product, partial [Ectocarpus fasciculatus]
PGGGRGLGLLEGGEKSRGADRSFRDGLQLRRHRLPRGYSGAPPGSDAVNFSEINRLRAGASQRPVHPDGHEGRGHRRQAGGQEDFAGGTLHHEHEPAYVRPQPCACPGVGYPRSGEGGDQRRPAGVSGWKRPGERPRLHRHAGVAGMGTGADDMVASAHAMSIGVGEVIGPMIGGFVVELLPRSPAFACEPDMPIVQLHDPIFQLAGELRPHQSSSSSGGGGGGGGGGDRLPGSDGERGQEELSDDIEVYYPETTSADVAVDARQGEDIGNTETQEGENVVRTTGQEKKKSRRLTLRSGEEQGHEQGEEEEEEDWIAVEFREGWTSTARLLGEDSHENEWVYKREEDALWMLLAEEEEEEKRARGKLRRGHPGDASSRRSASKPVEAGERRSDAGDRDDERELGQQQQQQQQQQRDSRALLERVGGRKTRRGRHRIRAKRERNHDAAGVTSSKGGEEAEEEEDRAGRVAVAAAAAAGVDGVGGLDGPGAGAGRPQEAGGGAADVEDLPVVGQALTAAAAAAAEGATQNVDAVDGDGGGGEGSCDSAFPLATTLLAWASGFAVLAMYRLLPLSAGGVGGGGGKTAHGVVLPA